MCLAHRDGIAAKNGNGIGYAFQVVQVRVCAELIAR